MYDQRMYRLDAAYLHMFQLSQQAFTSCKFLYVSSKYVPDFMLVNDSYHYAQSMYCIV